MNAFTLVFAVLLVSVTALTTVATSDDAARSVWLLVVCATVLPAVACAGAMRKSRRIGGREGAAWLVLAGSMGLMVPIYFLHSIEAYLLEEVLIGSAYLAGAVAIIVVPLPNAGRYQRIVASLDAVGIGVVVAIATFLLVSRSSVGVDGVTLWVMSDAVIMAMVAYVAVRRSQRRGIDWALLAIIAGVGAYLAGVLISSTSTGGYFIGHPADFAYFLGMTAFAVAPLIRERRHQASQQILRPVTWGHVLGPYVLVGVLGVAFIVHQASVWRSDPVGALIGFGILATMVLVLVRQVAMIAEQRHKVAVDQSGVIATISHELRTPLTTIVGFLDLLEDWERYTDDEKVEMVTLMRGQSRVLARVVGDLVDVAREKIDHVDLRLTCFRVREFVESVVGLVPELSGVELGLDIAPGALLTADRERMTQVVANYLSNAGQYGVSQVEVVAYDTTAETVVEVHDDGPGVPDIYHRVIWDRFERGPHRQSAIPGSGIGLSLVRGIVASHGGEAAYRTSELLGGACFVARIPLHADVIDRASSMPEVVPT